MKKLYTIITLLAIILIILIGLLFIEIPSPSQIVKEEYQIEVK